MAATGLYADPTLNRTILMTDRFWRYARTSRIVSFPDGSVAHFDANLRLSSLADSFGNTVLSLAYSGQTATVTQHLGSGDSRQVVVVFPSGCFMAKLGCMPTSLVYEVDPENPSSWRTWTYSGGGIFLEEVQPPDGPSWRYTYVADGNVRTVTVTTPHGGSVEYTIESVGFAWLDGETLYTNVVTERQVTDVRGGQSGGTWTFEYDWASLDLAKASTVIAPGGTRTRYEYGFVPGLIEHHGAAEYASRLYLIRQRKVWEGGSEPTCVTAVECETREYGWWPIPSWNAVTLPVLTSRAIHRAGRTHTTTFGYSTSNYGDFHHPNSIVENNGGGTGLRTRETTRTFVHSADAPYAAPYVVGLLAEETVEEPGAANRQILTSAWTYDATTGFLTSETRAGLTTTLMPDAQGNVTRVTSPTGTWTTYAYQRGQVRQIATPEQVTTRTINPDGTIGAETAGGLTTAYGYDNLMRVTLVSPPGGPTVSSATVTEYDNIGGSAMTVARGASVVDTLLDGFGRAIATTNSVGVRSVTRYDALARPTFVGYPVNAADPDIGTTIEYDALGRTTRIGNPDGSQSLRSYGAGVVTTTDEKNRTSVQIWEAFGHPDDARLVAMSDTAGNSWTYTYNVAGQMASLTGNGVTRTFVHDANFLLAQETHPESGTTRYAYIGGRLETRTDANNTAFAYVYDGNDRLRRVTAGSAVTDLTYEPGSDRLQSRSNGTVVTTLLYDAAGRLAQQQDAVDGKLFNTRYEYRPDDMLRAITYPSGRRIEYEYDSEQRIFAVREPGSGRDHAFGFTYHPSGAVETYMTGNLIPTQIAYDPKRYWVRSIASGSLQLTYVSYDPLGNVGAIGDPQFGPQAFTYDALDRLQTATGAYGSMTFAYDAHGNRQSAGGSTYQYEAGTMRLSNQNGIPFTYDSNGAMLTAGGATYTYTAANMLATAAVAGGTATYAYDTDEQRIRKTFAGSTTYSLRGLAGEVLTEWKDPGQTSGVVRDFVYAGTRLVTVVEKPTAVDPNIACGLIIPDGMSITVTIASGQTACLTFTAVAGRRYALLGREIDGDCLFDPLRISKPDGTTFVQVSASCRTEFLETAVVTTPGTYTILVDPRLNYSGTAQLTLYDVDDDITGTITPNGPPVDVTLTVAQKARFTFTAVAGRRYAVLGQEIDGDCLFDPLRISKPDGATFVQVSASCGTEFLETAVVTMPGTYTILVDPRQNYTGTARLRLYDVDDDIIGTITPNGPPVDVTFTVAQKARLTFTGVEGRRYALLGQEIAGDCLFNPLRISKPDGETFVQVSSTCAAEFLETPVVTMPGTYTILVDPRLNYTGTARLTLYDVDDDITGTITPDGPPVDLTFTVAQKARLTFTGVEGRRYALLGQEIAGDCLFNPLRISKPDGTMFVQVSSSCSAEFLETPVVTMPGAYTILVDPRLNYTGTARLSLYDVDDDVTGTLIVNDPAISISLTIAQVARLTFSGTAGQQITVRFSNNAVGTTTATLRGPDGSVVTSTKSNSSSFSLPTQTLSTTGVYTVVIDPSSSNTGSIGVRVTSP